MDEKVARVIEEWYKKQFANAFGLDKEWLKAQKQKCDKILEGYKNGSKEISEKLE